MAVIWMGAGVPLGGQMEASSAATEMMSVGLPQFFQGMGTAVASLAQTPSAKADARSGQRILARICDFKDSEG